MKVSEIREKTKYLEKDVVVELLVKAYRHVPKGKREELDQMILSGETNNTRKKTGDILPSEDSLLSSVINGYVDRETLKISLYAELSNVLKTADAKYLAIDCATETIRRIRNGIDSEEHKQSAKKYKSYSNTYYRQKDAVNNLCEFAEMLSINLGANEND